ncbi:fucose 4-O-acetylase-like acetyltransferase [Conyzicola lurida]|uniref:Fucose 4-O-acetylase-like acetyltransferase n=1 Tax=Conyzicola lurida TaxID=1172621 RepID=A0A841AJI2_9MICO|nr:acyltransferase family protein [Conyzicola lurida]MBB5842584.1 fucose 4-O-acetylase-like acetyltransferase [Conyzicola lurida]
MTAVTPPPTAAPAAPRTAPKAKTAAKERVPFWDNARFLCVALVVIGHGIQRLTSDSNNALIVYLFIYAFHMPAFAIISGYFSKPGPPGVRQMTKVITDIIVPYVIMESIWTLVQYLVEGKREFNPTQPSWTLWFLLALGIFRLILPYLALLRFPLLIALAASVGVGYLGNVDSTFSLSRAIGILPFFILGWKAKEWGIVDRWRGVVEHTWWLRGVAAAVLGAWLVVVVVNIQFWRDIDLRFWFFYDDSYTALGEDQWWAGLVRLGLIGLAVLLTAAFFMLIPRGDTWITGFGSATMYVYLLHSFILYPLRETGILKDEHASATWLLSMILACIAISIALSSPLVRRIFRPIIEPKPRWLFVEQPEGPMRSSRTDPTGSRRS